MNISTSGDAGDAIYLLNILKCLPDGPHTLLLEPSDATKAKGAEGIQKLYDLIGPLASAQPYIKECRIIRDGDQVDWKSAGFRVQHYTRGQTLMQAHLNHLVATKGIGKGITGNAAWLACEPSMESAGRVVVNRTGRYRNDKFPWGKVVGLYRHRILFIGLHHEWREFCGHFGYVEFRPTRDALEMAQLIAGSALFIGNQSCANALAEGLKHRSIQETSLVFPDCIYGRDNAQFVSDGTCVLPPVGDQEEGLTIRPDPPSMARYSTQISPPGKWQFHGIKPQHSFNMAVALIKQGDRMKGVSDEDIRRELLIANLDRCPGWQSQGEGSRVIAARHGAGLIH